MIFVLLVELLIVICKLDIVVEVHVAGVFIMMVFIINLDREMLDGYVITRKLHLDQCFFPF
jgi:hypothetical protein